MERKKIVLVLMLTAIFLTLAGCGGSGGQNENISAETQAPNTPEPVEDRAEETEEAEETAEPETVPEEDTPEVSVDRNTAIGSILDAIEADPDFSSDPVFEPLGAAADFNDDGTWELLAVYESGTDVCYELWSMPASGPVKLDEGVLFTEVGGNGGTAGIAKDGEGMTYLALERSEPDGDRFYTNYTFTPFAAGESALGDGWVYLECQGTYGDEANGRYILGDTQVEKAEFDQRLNEFARMYTIDILAGAGNGDVMPFDVLRMWDFND